MILYTHVNLKVPGSSTTSWFSGDFSVYSDSAPYGNTTGFRAASTLRDCGIPAVLGNNPEVLRKKCGFFPAALEKIGSHCIFLVSDNSKQRKPDE